MAKVYPVPRWLWAHATLPATASEVSVPPVAFTNQEVFDWNLHWLTITESTDGVSQGNALWASNIQIDLGISQYGDVNLVWAGAHALTYLDNPIRVLDHSLVNPMAGQGIGHDLGVSLHFPREPLIPANSGLNVTVQNLWANPLWTKSRIGILAQGYYPKPRDARMPMHLAGYSRLALTPGGTDNLDCSDLLNNGRDDAYLTDITATAGVDMDGVTGPRTPVFNSMLSGLAIKINPTTGIQWMPQPDPIPVGNIFPYNKAAGDRFDDSTRAYKFPRGIILKHRQRLHINLANLATSTILPVPLNICLFGTLEVR